MDETERAPDDVPTLFPSFGCRSGAAAAREEERGALVALASRLLAPADLRCVSSAAPSESHQLSDAARRESGQDRLYGR